MKRTLAITLLLLAACGGADSNEKSVFELTNDPVSVRGWILDVRGAKRGETMEMEVARRAQLFASSSVWVEKSQYASGGIAENGAFVVLDVPAQTSTIGFNAPGAETAQIRMQNVPGNAEVWLPDVILENGGAKFLDPSNVVVRMASSDVDKVTPTGKFATINGVKVPIVNAPYKQMQDRREYPTPPGFRPIATVK
jgi:hypothetical protein